MIRGLGEETSFDLFSNFKWVRPAGFLIELVDVNASS